MLFQIAKLCVAAGVITFASWLSNKAPRLAGFIIALPLTTMLALAFSHAEYGDSVKSVAFARSVVAAVPLSLLFFVPFLMAGLLQDKMKIGFWGLYGFGLTLLAGGYIIHKVVLGWFLR